MTTSPDATATHPTVRSVPILMYHQVSDVAIAGFGKYIHSPRKFIMQTTWLALAGYSSITFEMLIEYWRGETMLPRKPVIITFDDGYRDCVAHATRILGARQFTAYFYLVAGLMGQCSAWLGDARARVMRLIDWSEARALETRGFHCGAHSMTHPRLAELDAGNCMIEMRQSRAMLEEHLGHAVVHFAYPYGSCNAMVREAAHSAGFVTACTTHISLAHPHLDALLALSRVPMNGFDSLAAFIAKLRWGQTLPEKVTARAHRPGQPQETR